MTRLLPALLFSLFAALPLSAQDQSAAEKGFREVMALRGPDRAKAASDWLGKHASRLDKGHEYLRQVARFWRDRRPGEPGDALLASVSGGDWKPAESFAPAVLELLYARFELAVTKKEAGVAKEIAGVALGFAPDTEDCYRELGGMLRASEEAVFRKQFTRLMSRLFSDPRIDKRRRYPLSTEIMRMKPRPTRLSLFVKMPRAKGEDGKPVPNVDITGKEISLDQYRGKVLLIDFWATWCGPCLREMPTVVKAYEKYKDKGFDVLGISLDSEKTKGRMPEVMKRFGMPWRQICDGRGWKSRFAVANEVNAIPFTFLLDGSGEIRYAGLRGEKLIEKIEELLAENG